MFRSAVFKLTAAYVTIIMTLCIVFSIVLDHVAVRELHTGFYNQYSRLYDAYARLGLRQPGTPAQELTLRAHHILLQIVYFNLFVLVITSIACYMLARRTLRPIEAAHEQQKRFTADVSHELRTPLTSLKMETEVSLLNSKASAKQLRTTLRSNLEDVERMEVLINNLLLLSSMEANKLRTVFTTLDIADVVTTAVDSIRTVSRASNVRLDTKFEHALIRGERASLTQLFIILLSNAVKYSPPGSGVTVRTTKGRGRVIIDIIDHGSGISAEALPHVFDRFYRADNARARAAGESSPAGFGIGLSLAKLIADLHAGEIIISSSDDVSRGGTKAQVLLSSKL